MVVVDDEHHYCRSKDVAKENQLGIRNHHLWCLRVQDARNSLERHSGRSHGVIHPVRLEIVRRFIVNVPDKELQSISRVLFQIEQAHWFYTDFILAASTSLPNLNLKSFVKILFEHCSLLSHWKAYHQEAVQEFVDYKSKVPVCGAIVLNAPLTKVLLVRGWKASASWSFPKGKINKDELEHDCAVREVYSVLYTLIPTRFGRKLPSIWPHS